jgi:hypothetical protein
MSHDALAPRGEPSVNRYEPLRKSRRRSASYR